MHLIDISRELAPETPVWPGDQSFEWEWTAQVEEGDSVNVGNIRLSTHTGSHVDSPLHVRSDGASTDAFTIEDFVGLAEVIDVTESDVIRRSHVRNARADRILFKTSAREGSKNTWPESITPVDPEVVPLLQTKEVKLIGTDAPSVDPLDSTHLPAHHELIDAEIVNLEGLDLTEVSEGLYTLLALPLRLKNADAAPLRAVLGDASLLD